MIRPIIVISCMTILVSCKEEVVVDNSGAEIESKLVSSEVETNDVNIESSSEDTTVNIFQKPSEALEYSYETFQHELGWGYKILKDDQPVIIQKNIPSMPGVNGFASEENANKVGNYITDMVNRGIFPPTVDKKTLDSLQVL